MSVAFTFPGQGSQTVGMGRALHDSYAQAKAVFEEVDEALNDNLSQIIWDGPNDRLTLTANAQPALMAVSIAAMRVLEARGVKLSDKAAFVAGHSLGEYSALCAAGAISLADTARLLRIRGDAMQKAVPAGEGAMAAIIGLERTDVDAICADAAGEGCCQVANDNGGGQLVISGSKPQVEKAAELASERGAKRAMMLPVSAPFHSQLMQPAADAMQEALADVEIHPPAVPLVANVLATPIREPDEIRTRLVEQVTGQVRWAESVRWLSDHGVTDLIEVGAGKVLTGLARRINRDLKGLSVGAPDDLDKVIEHLA